LTVIVLNIAFYTKQVNTATYFIRYSRLHWSPVRTKHQQMDLERWNQGQFQHKWHQQLQTKSTGLWFQLDIDWHGLQWKRSKIRVSFYK